MQARMYARREGKEHVLEQVRLAKVLAIRPSVAAWYFTCKSPLPLPVQGHKEGP
jgi:hypothetical protein